MSNERMLKLVVVNDEPELGSSTDVVYAWFVRTRYVMSTDDPRWRLGMVSSIILDPEAMRKMPRAEGGG